MVTRRYFVPLEFTEWNLGNDYWKYLKFVKRTNTKFTFFHPKGFFEKIKITFFAKFTFFNARGFLFLIEEKTLYLAFFNARGFFKPFLQFFNFLKKYLNEKKVINDDLKKRLLIIYRWCQFHFWIFFR